MVTVDHHQDSKDEMTAEVHLVKKEMIEEDLPAIEVEIANHISAIEGIVTADHHQDLKDEMTAEVHLVKKMELQKNHMVLKKNLMEIKKILLENLQKNFKDLNLRCN
jgi:hypothetical protein